MFEKLKKLLSPAKAVSETGSPAPQLVPAARGRSASYGYDISCDELFMSQPVIAAGLRHFLDVCTIDDWEFRPSEDDKSGKVAEKVRRMVLEDCSSDISEICKDAATFRFAGFSLHEWTARRGADGDWTLADVSFRPQQSVTEIRCGKDGRPLIFIQKHRTGPTAEIPAWKCLHLTDRMFSAGPRGRGVFRDVEMSARRLAEYIELEKTMYDDDIRGIPLIRAPLEIIAGKVASGEMSPAESQAQISALSGFLIDHERRKNTAVMLDSSTYTSLDETGKPSTVPLWDVSTIKGGATSHAHLDKVIVRLNYEIARLLGVENMLLGTDGGGSLALADNKTEAFHRNVSAAVSAFTGGMMRQVIRPVFLLNGREKDLRKMPTMLPRSIRRLSPSETTDVLLKMAQAGAALHPLDPAVISVRKAAGLPVPDPELTPAVPDPQPVDQRPRPDKDNPGA